MVFVSYPDYAGNAYAMLDYLARAHPELELIWLNNGSVPADARQVPPHRALRRHSLRGLMALATARYVFHTHGLSRFVRTRCGQAIVNLWHGMPLKVIGTYDQVNRGLPQGDYAIATSERFRAIIARAFAMPAERVIVSGQPLTDKIVRLAAAVEDEGAALWLPTYRESVVGDTRIDSPLAPESFLRLLGTLDPLLVERGTRVVLKLHPMDALNRMDHPAFRAITVVRGTDQTISTERAMASARCLITDFSSAAIDYAVLGRPVGYFCPDRDHYARGFIPEVVEPFYAAGIELRSVTELADFIARPRRASAAAVAALNHHHDGRSCERVWRAVNQLERNRAA